MSRRGSLPAATSTVKSTLNKRFKGGPFKGLRFEEVSRDTTKNIVTIKLYGGRIFDVSLVDFNSWPDETIEP
jgi:hypothetical protein